VKVKVTIFEGERLPRTTMAGDRVLSASSSLDDKRDERLDSDRPQSNIESQINSRDKEVRIENRPDCFNDRVHPLDGLESCFLEVEKRVSEALQDLATAEVRLASARPRRRSTSHWKSCFVLSTVRRRTTSPIPAKQELSARGRGTLSLQMLTDCRH
jgi:hypothetical protein